MNVILLSHLGLGDNILNIPIVYYLLNTYKKVILVCYEHNFKNINYMFSKCPDVDFLKIKRTDNIESIIKEKISDNYRILRSGLHRKKSNIYTFPFFMYDDIGIPRHVLKTHFYVDDTIKSKQLQQVLENYKYIFISNATSQGELFSITNYINKLKININEYLIISPNINVYSKEHPYYGIADLFLYQQHNHLLLDYKNTLENANMIILSDSSMFIFCIMLKLTSKQNYVYTRTQDVDWYSFLTFLSEKKFTICNDC